jgi:hypothetical protein
MKVISEQTKRTQETRKDIYIHFRVKSSDWKICLFFMTHLQQKLKNTPLASPCLSVRQFACNKNITVQGTPMVFDNREFLRKMSINSTILVKICQQLCTLYVKTCALFYVYLEHKSELTTYHTKVL